MEDIDIQAIYQDAVNDPTLLSTIDIDALLSKIETEDNNYLENKTVADISKDIFDAIEELDLPKEKALDYCTRLSGYRYVDRICDLRNGRLMRWIKRSAETPTLTNGGLLMNVKIENKGVQLLCKNNTNRFFNVKFDDCLVFQKLTMEEQLIIMSYDFIENN